MTVKFSPNAHYSDVIMSTMASQITGVPIVYSKVCSGTDQRKHQRSASLAFMRGIHRLPVNSPHKVPVTRKTFPFNDVIMHIAAIIAGYRLPAQWNGLPCSGRGPRGHEQCSHVSATSISKHPAAEATWLPFCRRHFRNNFFRLNIIVFWLIIHWKLFP